MTGGVERVYLPPVSEWYENTEANRNQYLK